MSEQQVQHSLDTSDSEPKKLEDFAAALQRLEAIVERLEGGELGLEESLTAFEQGVRLTREARDRLDAAELKVKTLLEKDDGQEEEQSFKGGE